MTAAVAHPGMTRDPFVPQRPPGLRLGLLLALLAHALLIVGLAFSVDWHGAAPSAVEAELWSAVPHQAAPPAVAPMTQPTPPPPPVVRRLEAPAPALRPQPVLPAAPPPVDPQIAIEKTRQARQAEAQRELAEEEQARRDQARRNQSRQQELERQQAERESRQRKEQEQARDKQAADRHVKEEQARKQALAKAEKDNAERAVAAASAAATQQAVARAAYLKRIQGMAGSSGESGSTGSSAKSSGPSAGYAGRIMARIKPNIVFPDTVEGNPKATVEVRVAPDGAITSRRLVQSSGVKAWDDAVLRAIDRTDGLPRDIDGRVQPVLLIDFKRD